MTAIRRLAAVLAANVAGILGLRGGGGMSKCPDQNRDQA
jgi:hypothetical protein